MRKRKGLFKKAIACIFGVAFSTMLITSTVMSIKSNADDATGFRFAASDNYEMETTLDSTPLTYEATFKITEDEAESSMHSYILSNYSKNITNAIFNLRIQGYSEDSEGKRTFLGHPILSVNGSGYNGYNRLPVNVCTGEKVHLAVAIDNATGTFNWYINGEKYTGATAGSQCAVDTTYNVTVPVKVGGETSANSGNTDGAYYFKGELYSVAMFSDTRTAGEIEEDAKEVSIDDDNLMVAYDFTGTTAKPATFNDLSGNGINLVDKSKFWKWSKTSKYNPDDYAFSFMVVGDTQQLLEYSVLDLEQGKIEEGETYINKVYDYIADSVDKKKVKHVFGVGDITEYNSYNEWELAQSAMSKLNNKVSYSVIPGNHDTTNWFVTNSGGTGIDKNAEYNPYFKYHLKDSEGNSSVLELSKTQDGSGYTLDTATTIEYYNTFFGARTVNGETYVSEYVQRILDNGGEYYINTTSKGQAKYANTIQYFTGADNLEYMVVALEYGPTVDTLEWAMERINAHPNHNVIITTHGYMWANGTYLVEGDANWAEQESGKTGPNTGMIPTAGQNGTLAYTGDKMWAYIKANNTSKNVSMILCGHVPFDTISYRQDEGYNADGSAGNIITQMLIDPSNIDIQKKGQPLYVADPSTDRNLLTGLVATYYVSADGKTIDVEWYSPLQDAYYMEEGQFTFTAHSVEYPRVSAKVVGGNGSVTPELQDLNGDPVVITFTPDDEYSIRYVRVNGVNVTDQVVDNKLTITETTGYHAVEVAYEKDGTTEGTIGKPNSFYVVDGASVLLKTSEVGGKDNNGIRFVFEMSEEQFNSLLVDPNAETKAFKPGVSVGAMVVPTIHTGKALTDETVMLPDVINSPAVANQKIPVHKWTYAETHLKGGSGKVYYACAYVYNLPASAYASQISACAYITTSTGTVYTQVSTRSMAYVAGAALKDSTTGATEERILKGYIPTLDERLYSMEEAEIDLSNLPGRLLKIEDADGHILTGTLTNNVAQISGDDVLNGEPTSATGATETVTVYTTVATYKLPLKVCTDVINSAEEFDQMKNFLVYDTRGVNTSRVNSEVVEHCKLIRGYYALGNDIDFSGYTEGYNSPFSMINIGYQNYSSEYGWCATFDGNGYTISGLKIGPTTTDTVVKDGFRYLGASLFGCISATNGKVMNLSIKNASLDSSLGWSAIFASAVYGTVENVYIEANELATKGNDINAVFVGRGPSVGIENNGNIPNISNVTVVVNGLGNSDYVMTGNAAEITALKNGITVIGASAKKIHSGYTADTALGDIQSLVPALSNYEATNVVNVEKRLYSIDDATVDLKDFEGTVTGVYNTRGTPIGYTVNGTTATISGDRIFNGVATEATGATETLIVCTTEKAYIIPMQVCTDVIYSAKEFDEMKKFLVQTIGVPASEQAGMRYCKMITGYFALGSNIDFAETYPDGYDSPFSHMNVGYMRYGWEHAWKATFDGNGYTISNLKIAGSTNDKIQAPTWAASLFGIISSDGIVRNVNFENGSLATDLRSSAFFANLVYGTVENVTIEVTLATAGNNSAYPNAAFVGGGQYYGIETAGNISNVKIYVNGLGQYDTVMNGPCELDEEPNENGEYDVHLTGDLSGIKGTVEIFGAVEGKLNRYYPYSYEITAANSNIIVHGVELDEALYSIDDATLDLTGVEGEVLKVTDEAGNEIAYDAQTTKVSGHAVLNGEPTSATGEITNVIVYTTTAKYLLPLKVCTDVIYTATDFDNMKKFLVDGTNDANAVSNIASGKTKLITGYYILANDIDFAQTYPNGYDSPFGNINIGYGRFGWNYGWCATFDGNNKTISNVHLIESAQSTNATYKPQGVSLFGYISASNGVVKNVNFENCSLASNLQRSAFLANAVYGTVDNVYMEVKLTTNIDNSTTPNAVFAGFGSHQANSGIVKNGSISNVTVVVNGLGEYDYVMCTYTSSAADHLNSIIGSFDIIGAVEGQIHPIYKTIAEIRAVNTNIQLRSVELDERLYSIDDATLDLTGVEGDVVKITDESGNEIAYDAQTKKVSGHAVLNSATPTSATGEVTNVFVYTADKVYIIPLKVCTDVINSAAEFDEMKKFLVDTTVDATTNSGLTHCKEIQGYYVLGNDIDFAEGYANGYNSPFSYMNVGNVWRDVVGWRGTFDGNGYAIKNLKIVQTTQGTAGTSYNSLFGVIAAGATVKNVTFENASVAENLLGSAVFANGVFGTVDNVYIEATLATTSTGSNFVFAGVNTTVRGVVNYANVSNVTIVVNGLGKQDYVMSGAANGVNGIKGTMTISGAVSGSQIHPQYATYAAIKATNANIQLLTVELDERLYSIDDATLDLTGVEGDVVKITDASGNEIAYDAQTTSVSGHAVLNSATPTSATGEVTNVFVYTEDKVYIVPLKVCTDVINSAQEFDEMKKFLVDTTKKAALTKAGDSQSGKEYCQEINGYYALGNDIDFLEGFEDGYASPFSYGDIGYQPTGDTHGWNAVFDGNGHTIRNLKIIKSTVPAGAWSCSLFGVIHTNGTVKNVAFVDCSLANDLYGGAFLANIVCGTVDNVFMDITLTTTHNNASGNMAFAGQNNDRGVYSYANITNVTVIASGFGANDYVMKGAANGTGAIGNSSKGGTENGTFVVIGANEAKIHNQYATIADLQTANANIKAYTDVASASSATTATTPTLTTCGSTAFATAEGKFTITWNGETVYEETLATE